ncbi:Kynurenine--oxoglutarate transaminase [Nymphon striatum]|nr:Kynurenine--oxoglutarate transaminase [Nymphon striatum]
MVICLTSTNCDRSPRLKRTLIAINNPNNPTGALMDKAMLAEVGQIARACDAYVLCDEVYRGTDQDGSGTTASIVDVFDNGISTGSMSKSFSLAGLRLGWIAGPGEVIDNVAHHRDYSTISVGMLNDFLATIALENADRILALADQHHILDIQNDVCDIFCNTRKRVELVQSTVDTNLGRCPTDSVDEVVQAQFQELQHVLAGYALLAVRFLVEVAELTLGQAVGEASLLLFLQLDQAFVDDADHGVVIDQATRIHDGFGSKAQLGLRGNCRAQHVAGRHMDHAIGVDDALALSSFAGALAAEDDEMTCHG